MVQDTFYADTSEAERRIVAAIGNVARPRANVAFNRDLDHIPGERGMWHSVANLVGFMRHGAAHVTAQVQQYGPVFRHMVAADQAVFVSDPETLALMARNEDKAWSTALAYRSMFAALVPGAETLDFLTTFDFEVHRDVRKALQPAFSPAALASYVDVAASAYEEAIDQWLKRGKVSFKAEVRRLFADVAGRIFTGIDDPREAKLLDRATSDMWSSMTVLAKNSIVSPKWRRALGGYRTLHEALLPRVAARRNSGGTDLFSRLCQAQSDLLDDDGLVRLFIGIMLAAFDTTSLGTTSMAYLLAKHGTWQDRLREEARGVPPTESGFEGLKRLEQHDWVWKETLRLFPVASAIPRVSLRDLELGGHRIPAQTFVLGLIAPLLRDPRYWTAPERFDPERFAPDRAEDKRHRAAYLPFGTGPHVCLGMQLANIEAKVFWQTLLSRARIRLARDYEARHQFTPLGSVSGNVDLIVERV